MAKNLLQPESKPAESSSDEQLSSDSEYETDSEPETPLPKSATPQIQTPQPLPSATPASSESESESESGSGSESGSESESEESDPKPEPAPKPLEQLQKPKPNPTSSVQISPKGSVVGVKRAGAKVVETPDSKKVKKIEALAKNDEKLEGVAVEESGKKLFQRVFSMDDEIVLLKSMLDFLEKRKLDPVGNIDEFLEFVKQVLPLDVTKAQWLNKMKRLRSKYNGHASREKDGKEFKSSKQHERESYELSKRIWGGADGENNNGDGGMESAKVNGSVVKKNVKKKGVVPAVEPNTEDIVTVAVMPGSDDNKLRSGSVRSSGVTDDVGGSFMYSSLEERIMREEVKNIDTEMQRELAKKLSEIEEAELQLCARRCEYVALKARLMIAAKKN